MDSLDFAGKRVLLASLLPDTGHLTPLLQIAAELKKRGAEVFASVPIEAQILVNRFNIDAKYLGPVIPDGGKAALLNYSRAGEFSRLFIRGPVFTQNYITPLTANGLERFGDLVDEALEFSPDLILADTHLFSDEYRELAHRTGSKLILNYSKGSHYYSQDESLWLNGKGLSNGRFRTWARSLASASHYKLNRLLFPSRLARMLSQTKAVKATRSGYQLKTENEHNVTTIAAGTAELERQYVGDRIRLLPEQTRIFGPINPESPWGSDDDLREWLNSQSDNAVVYIAFGTMVAPSERILRSLVHALLNKNFKILMATKERPRFLDDVADFKSVVWKSWVPQPAVLSHPAVFAFASHSGATSVQEALWFGKPMLCLPVLWDQPYFAWLAEELGYGVWADGVIKGKLPLRQSVEKLASNVSLSETAKRLSEELRGQKGLQCIVAEIHRLLSEETNHTAKLS